MKVKLAIVEDSAKALQKEIKCLNKEFVLLKVNAEKVDE